MLFKIQATKIIILNYIQVIFCFCCLKPCLSDKGAGAGALGRLEKDAILEVLRILRHRDL